MTAPPDEKSDSATGASPRSASYFDVYWKERFNAASFRRRMNSLKRNYLARLPAAGAHLLEIGPGFGEMLQVLRAHGYTSASAIDNDPTLVEALRARGIAGVDHVADASGYLRARTDTLDGVIGLHVLEHFEPAAGRELLAAIYGALRPGGRVILEVPNMANFITAPYARWADYTHRAGYTQESLAAALRGAGFDVREVFGVARAVRSLGELAAWCTQAATEAIAWTLLKANYPHARIIAAPAIGAIGFKPPRLDSR